MKNPNPAHDEIQDVPPVDDLDLDLMRWIMCNIRIDDPVERRRHDLRGWAQAAGFTHVDVGNLGEPDFWEMRFRRGTNRECRTAAEAERWLGYIIRGCGCRIERGQLVVLVIGNRIAARFRLEPGR